jgi:hypothetical protein
MVSPHFVLTAMQLNHSAPPRLLHQHPSRRNVAGNVCFAQNYTLAVREKVCPHAPFAIGLRLSERAAVELSDRKNTCWNFSAGSKKIPATFSPSTDFLTASFTARASRNRFTARLDFAGAVAYTNLLFDLLAELLPAGIEGSVSTLPGSFKEFHPSTAKALKTIRQNIWRCVEHIARVSEKTKRKLHLGLEPEPLCLLENSAETIPFLRATPRRTSKTTRASTNISASITTPAISPWNLRSRKTPCPACVNHGIKISKIHLSSALKVSPTPEAREELKKFSDDVYLHQVVARDESGKLTKFRTLLVLGRVSNLPTVWSNCLAGWWLGGGGNFWKLPFLLLGVSALYTGGMFLNDAFDAEFDRQRRAGTPDSVRENFPETRLAFSASASSAREFSCCCSAAKWRRLRGFALALCILLYNFDAQFHHRVAVADGLVPVLGLCHRRRDGRGRLERLAHLVRRGAGVLCRRLELRRAARKFSRAGSVLAAAAAGRAGFWRC